MTRGKEARAQQALRSRGNQSIARQEIDRAIAPKFPPKAA
eukprot:COSAG06_NODE_39389_length_413_cov_0.821656_2_plen_39_part_01